MGPAVLGKDGFQEEESCCKLPTSSSHPDSGLRALASLPFSLPVLAYRGCQNIQARSPARKGEENTEDKDQGNRKKVWLVKREEKCTPHPQRPEETLPP